MDASIIIPVFNDEKYLRKCLDSVINQKTNFKYEIIVINDGSSDNSLNILKDYEKSILLIDKKNTGPGDTRNIGISKARGEYLLFVDADDYVSPVFVDVMISSINKSNADIVICDFNRVVDNKIIPVSKGKRKLYTKGNINDVLLMEFHSCNKIFKKEIFINNLYPNNMLYEDVVAISLNELNANSILKIEDKLYYYVQNKKSTTNIINKTNRDILKATLMIENVFLENNYKDEIEFLFVNNILVDLIIKMVKNKENKKDILEVYNMVTSKYPLWYNNIYLKRQKLFKRIYLFCLKHNLWSIIDFVYRR